MKSWNYRTSARSKCSRKMLVIRKLDTIFVINWCLRELVGIYFNEVLVFNANTMCIEEWNASFNSLLIRSVFTRMFRMLCIMQPRDIAKQFQRVTTLTIGKVRGVRLWRRNLARDRYKSERQLTREVNPDCPVVPCHSPFNSIPVERGRSSRSFMSHRNTLIKYHYVSLTQLRDLWHGPVSFASLVSRDQRSGLSFARNGCDCLSPLHCSMLVWRR